jgi:hypothetical protein
VAEGAAAFRFLSGVGGGRIFFVVLSMTITGLAMVMRWNRLFPDRRDFANLSGAADSDPPRFSGELLRAGGIRGGFCD